MEFKRYDGFFNGAPQKKFDKELPLCPFCGEDPHWNLNIKNGFTASVTCMCEKCKGKLNAEYTVLDIDNLRVIDVGTKNTHNLVLNASYHIVSLNSLAETARIYDVGDDSLKQTPTPNIAHIKESDIAIAKKKRGAIWGGTIGVISFVIALCIFLWMIIPSGGDNLRSNKLEPVQQASMSVEESFGCYYVTITGSAKNASKRTMDYVSITFTLYDSAGNVVGTAIANQSGLGAGETWVYSASGISTTNRPVSCKSTDVTVL